MTRVLGDPLRTRLAALLAVLTLFWAYAAYLTFGDAMELVRLRALGGQLGQPTDTLILHLQTERRLTMAELASPGVQRAQLVTQRAGTDAAVALLGEFHGSRDPRLAGTGPVRQRAGELVRRLAALGPLRASVDAGTTDRGRATTAYTEVIDAGFAVYGAQWTSRETGVIERTRAYVALARAREILAREDALVTGILTGGRSTATERAGLADLVAAQRFVRAEAAAALPEPERARYQRFSGGESLTTLRRLEDRLVAAARDGRSPAGSESGTDNGTDAGNGTGTGSSAEGGRSADRAPAIAPQVWRAAVEPVLAGLRELVTSGVRDGVARAAPAVVGVVLRVGIVGGLGFVVVVAALLGTVRGARHLRRRLDRLREMAETLAEDGLPDLAHRLHRGEAVEPGPGWPAPAYGPDPVARVGQAIDAVRRGTVRVLTEQAERQRHQRDVFLHLTRRNQVLLRRQLNLLDAIQRRETGAEELSDLFRVDHLATRIRRNVEGLITAAGGVPARRWRRPVPLVDVVRGAVAEVEDFPRVLIAPEWSGSLAGPAVNDLIHLLAELVENGLTYSPPASAVRISGGISHGDQVIRIRDAGPGLSPEALAASNALLRDPPAVRPPGTGRGLYLVARTARRWGVTVELGPSPRAGTTALVRIPASLTADGSGPDPVPETTTGPIRDTAGKLPRDATTEQPRMVRIAAGAAGGAAGGPAGGPAATVELPRFAPGDTARDAAAGTARGTAGANRIPASGPRRGVNGAPGDDPP